jgi:hypothetical protein
MSPWDYLIVTASNASKPVPMRLSFGYGGNSRCCRR